MGNNIHICTEDCNDCPGISQRQISLLLNVLWKIYGEEVITIVDNVCPSLTICPDCHCDDMAHKGGCEILAAAEEIVPKLCAKNPAVEAAREIMAAAAKYYVANAGVEKAFLEGK